MLRSEEKVREQAIMKAEKKGHTIGKWGPTATDFGRVSVARCTNAKCHLPIYIVHGLRRLTYDGDVLFESCPPAGGWEKRQEIRELISAMGRALKNRQEHKDALSQGEAKVNEIGHRLRELEIIIPF